MASCHRSGFAPTPSVWRPQSHFSPHGSPPSQLPTSSTRNPSIGGPSTDTSGLVLAGLERKYILSQTDDIFVFLFYPATWTDTQPTSIWVFFFLPEVKDRTLEEIDEMVREEFVHSPREIVTRKTDSGMYTVRGTRSSQKIPQVRLCRPSWTRSREEDAGCRGAR